MRGNTYYIYIYIYIYISSVTYRKLHNLCNNEVWNMHRKSRERKMAGLSYHRNSNECWSSYGHLISILLRTLSSILVLRIYYIDMLKKIMAGSSCETGRTSAYSEDIRWRMVYQRICLRKSYRDIVECLNVDSSTV